MNEGPVVLSSLWNWFFFLQGTPNLHVTFPWHASKHTSVYSLTVFCSTWNWDYYSLLNSSYLHPVTVKSATIRSPSTLPFIFLHILNSCPKFYFFFHLVHPRIWPLLLFYQNSYPNLVTSCSTSRSSFSLALAWALYQDIPQHIT